jgi:hypothetical protein
MLVCGFSVVWLLCSHADDYRVGPIAICPLGNYIAVGVNDGRVSLHVVEDDLHVEEWRIRLRPPQVRSLGYRGERNRHAVGVAFSHSGSLVAASWGNGDVAVFETSSTACVASFHDFVSGHGALTRYSTTTSHTMEDTPCCYYLSSATRVPLRLSAASARPTFARGCACACVRTCVAYVSCTCCVTREVRGLGWTCRRSPGVPTTTNWQLEAACAGQ